jgi:hypothetical protein
MDTNRFEEIVRTLATMPSRRAVIQRLVGLTAGSLLAPITRVSDAAAKDGKKAHKHKEHRRKKRKKNKSDRCPRKYEYCPAGEYSECCRTAIGGVSGNPFEVCTACGCCAYHFTTCCGSAGDGLCCHDSQQCCYSDDFKESACCEPKEVCCGAGCCGPKEECCKTTGENPYRYCCAEGLTCKPSGGPTCVQK